MGRVGGRELNEGHHLAALPSVAFAMKGLDDDAFKPWKARA